MLDKLMKIIGQQFVPSQDILKVLKQLAEVNKSESMVAISIYNYGVMEGIRKERNRRNLRQGKKVACNE